MLLDGPERLNGFRQGKLLSDITRDESPAADFSFQFHPSIHDEQVAPRLHQHFASQQIPEDHPIPVKQLPRNSLSQCGVRMRRALA